MQSRNALRDLALAIFVFIPSILSAPGRRRGARGRIVAIGVNEEMLAIKGENTEVVDLTQSLAENVGRALVWPHGTIRRRSRSGGGRPGCGQSQPGRAARHGGRRSRFRRGRAARGRKPRQVEPLRMAQSRGGPAATAGPGRRIQRDPGGADARCAEFPRVAHERQHAGKGRARRAGRARLRCGARQCTARRSSRCPDAQGRRARTRRAQRVYASAQ